MALLVQDEFPGLNIDKDVAKTKPQKNVFAFSKGQSQACRN